MYTNGKQTNCYKVVEKAHTAQFIMPHYHTRLNQAKFQKEGAAFQQQNYLCAFLLNTYW